MKSQRCARVSRLSLVNEIIHDQMISEILRKKAERRAAAVRIRHDLMKRRAV